MQIFSDKQNFEEIRRELRKESQNAFKNEKVREPFYPNIASVLENYRSNLTNQEKATKALNKIAEAFGLDWNNLINL